MFWKVLRYASRHDSAVWKFLAATTIIHNTMHCESKVGYFYWEIDCIFYSLRRSLIFLYKLLHFRYDSCSQSRRNFGERVLGIFLTKIMATTLDFNGSRTLGRERNLYQGGGRRSKIRRGVGWGSVDNACLKSLLFCKLRSPTTGVPD